MGDFKPSASASAEANAIKVQGNTINVNRSHEDVGTIEGIVRLIAPVAYERRKAIAKDVQVDSLISSAKKIQEAFPGMSERRAVMEAAGFRMTNAQAENATETLVGAQEIIDKSKKDVPGLSPEATDCIVNGSKEAYDEHIRKVWSKAAAGEAESPGTFSKGAFTTLSRMGKYDVATFEKICSYTFSLFVRNAEETGYHDPKPLLVRDSTGGTFNGGEITLIDIAVCNHLGLLDSSLSETLTFPSGMPMPLKIGNMVLMVLNQTESNVSITFGGALLLPLGKELSRLCDNGIAEGAVDMLKEKLESNGLSVYPTPIEEWEKAQR